MTQQEMDTLIVQERRSYQKQWRAKNKDRVREYNHRFWEKKAISAKQQRENSDDERKD